MAAASVPPLLVAKSQKLELALLPAVRTVGSQVGREIVRGLLGSILGKRR